jgi:hypothetical protein
LMVASVVDDPWVCGVPTTKGGIAGIERTGAACPKAAFTCDPRKKKKWSHAGLNRGPYGY